MGATNYVDEIQVGVKEWVLRKRRTPSDGQIAKIIEDVDVPSGAPEMSVTTVRFWLRSTADSCLIAAWERGDR